MKHLLYTEKYTIEGARQRIDHYRRTGELRSASRKVLSGEAVAELRVSLKEVMDLLDGRAPTRRSEG